MASSPPKRRKTSPTTSIPVDATPQHERPSAIDAPHTAPGRASFLSPTKASLARFNPGLLERPKFAGRERPQSRGGEGGPLDTSALGIPTATNGIEKEAANGRDETPSAANTIGETAEERNGGKSSDSNATLSSPERTTRLMSKQGLRASPRRRSRTSAVPPPPSEETREPLATVSESVAQSARENGDAQLPPGADNKSPMMRALQALAQLDGGNDEREAEEPGKASQTPAESDRTNDKRETEEPRKAVQALTQVDGANGEPEAGEPELPPTPSQLGLADPVVSRPPAGLLNTPSKRPRKNRALGEALASSPTKPRPIRRATASPMKDTVPRPTRQKSQPETVGTKRRQQESPGSAEQGGVSYPKRQKRDDLREHLRKLQDEVAMYEKQVNLAREVREVGRPTIDPANEEDRRKIISLLLESNDRSLSPPEPPQPSSLSLLNNLLPFSKQLPAPTRPSPPSPQGPIPSHRPINLADPLPYLTLFTPLTFTSTTTLLQPTTQTTISTSHTPPTIHQHHLINAHSPHCLLTTTISLTVNTSSLHVSDLKITTLSPWAEPELGTWVRERAKGRGAEGRDIAGICWAMGRYWEVARRRAKCWWRCEMAFGDLVVGSAVKGQPPGRSASNGSAVPPRQKGRKAARPQTTPEEAGDDASDASDASGPQPTRRDLTRHLGRTSLLLQRNDAELLIKWRITFDWTGEAESAVSAVARAPSAWKQVDERDSLGKIPEVFDGLVRERGVFGGVGALVGLLFP